MAGGEDHELEADLVGATSARMLAAGVPRGERMGALRLLGVLLTLADGERRVRRPIRDVGREFELPVERVERWLDELVDVGAVTVDPRGVVLAADELRPAGNDAFRLHDFLEAAAELDAEVEPVAPRPRARRLLAVRPVGAVLAAAALLVAVLVAPRVLEDEPAPASSERDGATTIATSGLDPGTTTAPTPRPSSTAPPASESEGRVGPVRVPRTSTTLLPCPTGIPTIEVLGTTTGADGRLAVDGIARNPSSEALAVQSFTLRATIAGQDIAVPGLERPLPVPGGSSVLWQARLPVVAPAGTLVRVTLGDWEWRGTRVRCPSP
jgi:hypothetical protein